MKSHIRQNRAARWLAHVEHWRHSGMSKAAYCTAHGLNFSSFRYWLRKSRSASVDVSALPPAIVPLPFTLAPKAPSIGLMVGTRYALDIPADFDEVTLTRLLSVLEPRC
ncbi:IS66 family insertion sequence element accessory protein TnpA [Desulfomicrobium salsuginis]